ncbi:MAG: AraC family transcriptional regulator [Candidatus Rokuibacteriota bacterium]|nr:MAG: AraC family transcriptional regulator [Candidatus Rokubacteria bacterium]
MPRVFKATGADVLSEVLQTLRLRGQVFCVCELSAPWSMSLPAGDLAHFHVLERGAAALRLQREQAPIPLETGDLVIVPHGSGHVLSDGATQRPVRLEELLARRRLRDRVLRHGGDGPETHMICGAFHFENGANNPIIALLPPVIRVRAGAGSAVDWLKPTLDLLANETRHAGQGSGALVTRLTEIIFVQSVRAWIADQPVGAGGWLGALRDRQIGAALALMHQAPEHDWHVAELARKVGMSRSPFAARFTALVGTPPLAYLNRWRLHVSTTLLQTDELAVRAIAERVGYESEAAFSKAFKRRFGASPGAYRRKVSHQTTQELVASG